VKRAAAAAAILVIAGTTLGSLACSSTRAPAAVIRVGYSGEPDFSDLPSLIAHEKLRAQGITVESTFFSGAPVAIAEVSRGTVDVMNGSMIGAWMAISRGAHLRTVMDHTADPYRFIVAPGISDCKALKGRRVGLATDSSVSTHLVRAFLAESCDSIAPEALTIGESSARVAAFLAGGIDAAALESSSWFWLQKQAPGRFTMLSDFSTRWPNIRTTGVHVNTDFARRHGDLLRAYLAAVLAAHREVLANPTLLVKAAEERMGRSEDWLSTARAYVDSNAWSPRGGLTRDSVASTLSFFQTYSHLDANLTATDVADLTFLDDVLADTHD
jgi:ABC-type nitrate/sulfonate/bicarbonate transport system substrate-binding protein